MDEALRPPRSAKIVVAGGFGAGKTTLVGTISEIVPLTTEAAMTSVAVGIDDTRGVSTKTTTTVAMDFGRITIDERLLLYLFGTPGQDRFAFMWDDISLGALGAIILVDTRRLEDCYPALDYFESRSIPYVVGLNRFDGSREYPIQELREALGVADDTPVVTLDARDRESIKRALLTLLTMLRGRLNGRTLRRAHLVSGPRRA